MPTGAAVMVILDSDHSRDHVLAELRSYGPMVTKGCYLVVADTILGHFDADQTPHNRSKLWLKGNEPLSALSSDGAPVVDIRDVEMIGWLEIDILAVSCYQTWIGIEDIQKPNKMDRKKNIIVGAK